MRCSTEEVFGRLIALRDTNRKSTTLGLPLLFLKPNSGTKQRSAITLKLKPEQNGMIEARGLANQSIES